MSGLLLDTHAFLWIVSAEQISPDFAMYIQEAAPIFVSIVSLWEISIKVGLGKLQTSVPPQELFGPELASRGVAVLPLEESDVEAYSKLAFPNPNHREPFDRMLVIQAIGRSLRLVSADSQLDAYGVDRLWE